MPTVVYGDEPLKIHYGFRMIKNLEITNFRCFENLRLGDLSRVNVVTGANAAGKTAFFEALYIGTNATAVALQNISMFRSISNPPAMFIGGGNGLPIAIQPQNLSNFESLFRTSKVGHQIQTAKEIKISFQSSEEDEYELTIFYPPGGGNVLTPVVNLPGGANFAAPLFFRRQKKSPDGNTEETEFQVTVNQIGQLQQPHTAPFGPAAMIFGSGLDYPESDNVAWFSQLKEKNAAEAVISFICQEFPFIKNLEVLAPPPGNNALYANMTDGTSRRVNIVSAGINKLLSILLACAHTRRGIIIIDEIENGIFYEKYEAVWDILFKFAERTENQIFVSSHSRECIDALAGVMGNREKEFSLLRMEKREESYSIKHISGQSLRSAIEFGGEVRG